MADFQQKAFVGLDVHMKLNEGEARALKLISDYDPDSFVGALSTILGSAGAPHAPALKGFIIGVRGHMPGILRRLDLARAVFDGKKLAVDEPAPPIAYRGSIKILRACGKHTATIRPGGLLAQGEIDEEGRLIGECPECLAAPKDQQQA